MKKIVLFTCIITLAVQAFTLAVVTEMSPDKDELLGKQETVNDCVCPLPVIEEICR